MLEQHISTKQVCLLLGISLSTFYRYCKAGLLKPAFLTSGKHRRFSLSQLRQSFCLDPNAVLTLCYSRVFYHDVIELMTVFCAKLYGKRSHKNKVKNI